MSAETIITTIESDANAVLSAGLARLTALETAWKALGAPAIQALVDATAAVESAVASGASVAAAATNPATAAVAIGAVAVPVTSDFVAVFNEVKGFVEGVTGQTPAPGASQQEQDGDAAGVATKNLFDAIVDSVKTL